MAVLAKVSPATVLQPPKYQPDLEKLTKFAAQHAALTGLEGAAVLLLTVPKLQLLLEKKGGVGPSDSQQAAAELLTQIQEVAAPLRSSSYTGQEITRGDGSQLAQLPRHLHPVEHENQLYSLLRRLVSFHGSLLTPFARGDWHAITQTRGQGETTFAHHACAPPLVVVRRLWEAIGPGERTKLLPGVLCCLVITVNLSTLPKKHRCIGSTITEQIARLLWDAFVREASNGLGMDVGDVAVDLSTPASAVKAMRRELGSSMGILLHFDQAEACTEEFTWGTMGVDEMRQHFYPGKSGTIASTIANVWETRTHAAWELRASSAQEAWRTVLEALFGAEVELSGKSAIAQAAALSGIVISAAADQPELRSPSKPLLQHQRPLRIVPSLPPPFARRIMAEHPEMGASGRYLMTASFCARHRMGSKFCDIFPVLRFAPAETAVMRNAAVQPIPGLKVQPNPVFGVQAGIPADPWACGLLPESEAAYQIRVLGDRGVGLPSPTSAGPHVFVQGAAEASELHPAHMVARRAEGQYDSLLELAGNERRRIDRSLLARFAQQLAQGGAEQ
ncbi:hypothetical protein WJX72_008603 [[Myrmecia] bisecta]|uniref:Uncharacterized protein n=1 Tax=[Myrmecia] bisecta TaxID=41462 RepID=A0AAW1QFT9_9CHLO